MRFTTITLDRVRSSMLLRASAVTAAAALALTGCATSTPATDSTAPAGGATSTSAPATAQVTVTDPWVKAAEQGMTGAFGTITNPGSEDLVLVAASTSVATSMELHETVGDGTGNMVMQEVDGGFTIPAGGELVLKPGGDHLMLMGLTAPVQAGDELEFTLEFADGSTVTFTAVAKDFAGANEQYGGNHGGHGTEQPTDTTMGGDH